MRVCLLWICVACLAPIVHGQEPGQAVLARRDILEDYYYYAATFERLEAGRARVLYENGKRGIVHPAAIQWRTFRAGDFVFHGDAPARVVSVERDGRVRIAELDSESATSRVVRRGTLRAVFRTDSGLSNGAGAAVPGVGKRVLAKWDARSWWVAEVTRAEGEALDVAFADGTQAWLPGNRAIELSVALSPGSDVLATNPRDGQVVPGSLQGLTDESASIDFFDGSTRSVSLAELVVFHDQYGLRYGDPRRDAASSPITPSHAAMLRSWLTDTSHYYFEDVFDSQYGTKVDLMEMGFVLFVPRGREPRKDGIEILKKLGQQVEVFLERELTGVDILLRVHPQPVIGKQTLPWYIDNLDEEDAWHVWAPTGDAVRAVFPDGPKEGRHRVVVVVPDAPGISADDSGTEDGMGFVRAQGDWFQDITLDGLKPIDAFDMSHDEWKPDYLAATLAHEVLHTIGLPHTDGNPWSIMNLGPWFPITHPRVYIAELHKLVMRSPFRSLSLSQGMAAYLLDGKRHWLDVVRARDRWDTRLRLYYTTAAGRFGLRRMLESFGPDTNGRDGVRDHTGERVLCRSHLAAFVAFVLEKGGPEALKKLCSAADGEEAESAAKVFQTTVAKLEKEWHAWLEKNGA